MTTVFLSGSRKISRLNQEIIARLRNITEQGFEIVLGDANGADKALQHYLAEVKYQNVIVFYSGDTCRNNVGHWKTRHVAVDNNVSGRAFYIKKDQEMAGEADYGFVLWDGESPGSIGNVIELLKRNKKALVYLAPECKFYSVAGLEDANALLQKCEKETLALIGRKIRLSSALRELQQSQQNGLGF